MSKIGKLIEGGGRCGKGDWNICLKKALEDDVGGVVGIYRYKSYKIKVYREVGINPEEKDNWINCRILDCYDNFIENFNIEYKKSLNYVESKIEYYIDNLL